MSARKTRPSPGLYLQQQDKDKSSTLEHDTLLLCLKCCRQCSEVGYPVRMITPEEEDAGFLDCGLPCVVSDSGCFHSGLTACMRQIVMVHLKESIKFRTTLLGYHDNCLRSCAEVSPWTYLCEYTLQEIADNLSVKGVEFAQSLETHLRTLLHLPSPNSEQNPLDMHPVLKPVVGCDELSNGMAGLNLSRSVPRRFIDHTSVTILDLIIFTLFSRMPSDVYETLPKVRAWYQRMWSIPAVRVAAYDLGYQENKLRDTIVAKNDIDLSKNIPVLGRKKKSARSRKHSHDASPVTLKLREAEIHPNNIPPAFYKDGKIDWNSLPSCIHPLGGNLPEKRLERKVQQLDNLVQAVLALAKDEDTIVDFCSGGGHLGLVLAYLLPQCHIIMIENKEESLNCAVTRANEQRLTNATFYQCNLTKFTGRFYIGVSLHACGSATDLVLDQCRRVDASFVLCPCCYGSIEHTDTLNYPRSKLYGTELTLSEYKILTHAADQTELGIELAEQGKRSMNFVDWDRCLLAQEGGYTTLLTSLIPPECTPKNNVIIGFKGHVIALENLDSGDH